jgi:hypothetical protein
VFAYLSIVSIASNTPFNDEEFSVDMSFESLCIRDATFHRILPA